SPTTSTIRPTVPVTDSTESGPIGVGPGRAASPSAATGTAGSGRGEGGRERTGSGDDDVGDGVGSAGGGTGGAAGRGAGGSVGAGSVGSGAASEGAGVSAPLTVSTAPVTGCVTLPGSGAGRSAACAWEAVNSSTRKMAAAKPAAIPRPVRAGRRDVRRAPG